MSWLRLFNPRQQPQCCFEHAILGTLRWEPNEKEWAGTYEGLTFSITHEKQPVPAEALLEYAVALLGNKKNLLATLETEKQLWAAKYPLAVDEILPLQFDEFALYRYKGACRALVLLKPESVNKAWRMEFDGLVCKGLGFDS